MPVFRIRTIDGEEISIQHESIDSPTGIANAARKTGYVEGVQITTARGGHTELGSVLIMGPAIVSVRAS